MSVPLEVGCGIAHTSLARWVGIRQESQSRNQKLVYSLSISALDILDVYG